MISEKDSFLPECYRSCSMATILKEIDLGDSIRKDFDSYLLPSQSQEEAKKFLHTSIRKLRGKLSSFFRFFSSDEKSYLDNNLDALASDTNNAHVVVLDTNEHYENFMHSLQHTFPSTGGQRTDYLHVPQNEAEIKNGSVVWLWGAKSNQVLWSGMILPKQQNIAGRIPMLAIQYLLDTLPPNSMHSYLDHKQLSIASDLQPSIASQIISRIKS